MNKIGFRIYRFKEGPSIGLTVNEGDWTKKVVDIRDILKLYNSEDESKFAMFLSFSETGAYITIARSISGRGGDNTAAWIYIPNNIEVTGSDIIPIIEVVKEELSASKSNVERLTQIFAQNYRTVEAADYMPSSLDKVFAKRDVGFYPLKDILGEKRYQPIYSNYHVILINDNDGMEIVDKNLTDLTNEMLVETFVFCPPLKQDIPNGVTVHFNTHGYPLFNKPVRVNKSSRISLVFKRTGFEDIPYIDSVEENDQLCGVPRFDWRKSVSRDQFKIVAAHDSNVNLTDNATITVNNEELKWHQPILISEHDARQAKVRVSVNGYEPEEEYLDLLNVAKSITVKLHRAERAQSWKIELANGHTAVMDLRSKYLSGDKYESPIKGYSREDGILRNTNFGVLKQRTIGFLIAVATFVVICICVAAYEWFDNHNFTWQLGWPLVKVEKIGSHNYSSVSDVEEPTIQSDINEGSSGQNISENEKSLDKAIAYLNNTTGIWRLDSLRNYGLEQLFEELNTYEVDSILRRTELQQSSRFKEIIDVIKLNRNKILANKDKSYKGPYCKDGEITVDNYIKKLNKQIDEVPAPSSEGVVSKAAKDAQTASKSSSSQKEQAKDSKGSSSSKKNSRGNTLDDKDKK